MASPEQPKRRFAYHVYTHRKAGMDEDVFHKHIETVNTPIIKMLLEKYGAVSYTVSHNDTQSKASLARLFPGGPTDMMLEYDAVISMIVPEIETIEKMRQDPDFTGKFIPDHFNFADMSRSKCTIGWAEHYEFPEH